MASQNVELVHRLNEIYNTRDFEPTSELMDPEFVWDMSRMEILESASYGGLPGVRTFFETWNDGFASEHVEVEEIREAGDRVFVAIHHTGRGRSSGIEVDQRYAMVWTLRAGRALRMDMYPTREEALAAAGLEGQARA
jgi:ketosteroid isomerase-like protein